MFFGRGLLSGKLKSVIDETNEMMDAVYMRIGSLYLVRERIKILLFMSVDINGSQETEKTIDCKVPLSNVWNKKLCMHYYRLDYDKVQMSETIVFQR